MVAGSGRGTPEEACRLRRRYTGVQGGVRKALDARTGQASVAGNTRSRPGNHLAQSF